MGVPLEDEEPARYHDLRANRWKKVRNFSHSRSFRQGQAMATIAALPRCHMARALYQGRQVAQQSGIGRAARACLTATGFILSGQCESVSYLLSDFADFERYGFPLSILRDLLRTFVYILCAHLRYPSIFYLISVT